MKILAVLYYTANQNNSQQEKYHLSIIGHNKSNPESQRISVTFTFVVNIYGDSIKRIVICIFVSNLHIFGENFALRHTTIDNH